jgi:Tfp pilus assembly protein PilN
MISLTKGTHTSESTARVRLPFVNLMPPEIAERRRFRRVQTGLAGAVLAAVVVVGLLFLVASGGVSDANDEVVEAQSQQRAVQAETARYRDVTATYKRAADAQALLVAAMGQEVRYSRFLNDLTLTIPPNVWIKNVAYTQTAAVAAPAATATSPTTLPGIGTVTLSGVAYSHDDVAQWLDSLAAQKGYTGITLQSSTEALLGTRNVANWSSTVVLSADALSGRYVKAGG